MQAEAFSYALGYNEKDYSSIGTSTILATPIATVNAKSQSLYNGNIASMTSKTPAIAAANFQQQYSYDQLNRITASNTPGAANANVYRTSYSYDANGNIKTLGRYDDLGTKFDQLSYNYETKAAGYEHNTNKLRWVDDMPTVSATTADIEDQNTDNYSYDAIGNLIADTQEEIKNIEWTVSGKVKRVTRLKLAGSKKPDLEFEYDAGGQRIVKKVIKTDGTTASTYYLRDASGNVMSVYEITDSDNAPVLAEQYIYGSLRVGVYTPVAAGSIENMGSRSFGRKSYELSDHLGNVRATLSDYRRLAKPQIVNSATDYYPFGSVARSYTSSQEYDYGFNGKMKDDEIVGGDYDFGARIYDSRIVRWLAIDPLIKKYPSYTPYCFAINRPTSVIDPDGGDIIILSAPSGAAGFGHAAVLIGNDKTGWVLYSKNGTTGSSGTYGPNNVHIENAVPYLTLEQFANEHLTDAGAQYYTAAYRIPTTITQDAQMEVAANIQCTKTYGLLTASCTDVCSDALKSIGLDPGYNTGFNTGDKVLPSGPNARFENIKRNNVGMDISSQIMPTSKIYQAILKSNLATHIKKEVVLAYNAATGNNESKTPVDYQINIFESNYNSAEKVTELTKTLTEAGLQVEVTKSVASTSYSIFGVSIEHVYKINVKAVTPPSSTTTTK